MARFGRILLLVALVLGLGIFVIGLLKDFSANEMLRLALSMLVSVVPEGLPVAVTVVLSVGLLRMFRKHALIRRLSAAETLGSATVVCVDKTGTLTEGKMMVERLLTVDQDIQVTGHGYSLSGKFLIDQRPVAITKFPAARTLLELASLATMSTIAKEDLADDEAKQLTDPTETALAVVAAKAGFYAFKEERSHPELLEMPFDQELRYSTSIHRFGERNRLITKGSPERILQLSTHVLGADGKQRRLLSATRSALEERASQTARLGYRLVALGYADKPKSVPLKQAAINGLTFVGFLAIADPLRTDVRSAVTTAKAAGVRVMMLTGDHLLTAQTIAHRIGLDEHGEVIHAADIANGDLAAISVVARATPADKLKIVERLQRSGEIVAMTGDGVNDAPALKRADIGIAMGRSGTDVAIEAAQMVLLRDNFSAIIAAIEEGRLIWENLRKVVFYLTSTTLAEVLILIVCLLIGLPLPLVAIQILWMNLVTDGIMSMALTVEPSHQHLMNGRNRAAQSGQLLDRSMAIRMLIVSAVMMIGSLAVFRTNLDHGIDYARTATLTTMVFFQLLNVFNARSHSRSMFTLNPLGNRLLIISFVVALAVHLFALYSPSIGQFLGIVPLPIAVVTGLLAFSASIILVDELRKLIRVWLLQWARFRLDQGQESVY
jgi:Ca2+-transporting ATPase